VIQPDASRWAGVVVGMHEVGRFDSASWLQNSPIIIIRDEPDRRNVRSFRSWVGQIMCSTASSGMIGISVPPLTSRSAFPAVADGVQWRLASVSHRSHITLEPAVTAVEALRDGGGWPAALHQFGPEQALGTVRLTEASLSN
jgi:hypothetical protein